VPWGALILASQTGEGGFRDTFGRVRDTFRADIGRVDRMNAPAARERPGARQQEVES
jgi:hypothetical protein